MWRFLEFLLMGTFSLASTSVAITAIICHLADVPTHICIIAETYARRPAGDRVDTSLESSLKLETRLLNFTVNFSFDAATILYGVDL